MDFNPSNALHAAHALLYRQLGKQALLWAFVDVFRWTAILRFVCALFVWMFKKVKGGKSPMAVH